MQLSGREQAIAVLDDVLELSLEGVRARLGVVLDDGGRRGGAALASAEWTLNGPSATRASNKARRSSSYATTYTSSSNNSATASATSAGDAIAAALASAASAASAAFLARFISSRIARSPRLYARTSLADSCGDGTAAGISEACCSTASNSSPRMRGIMGEMITWAGESSATGRAPSKSAGAG